MRLTRTWLSAALALAACDGGTTIDAGGDDEDAGRIDSGGVDAGREVDSGGVDAGPFDAGMTACGSLTLPALSTEDIITGDWSAYEPIAIAQPLGEDEDLY